MKMKRYELRIKILDPHYVDDLVITLARQGYAPYISERGELVCFDIDENEMIEIKE